MITFDPPQPWAVDDHGRRQQLSQHGRDLVALLDALGLTGIHLVAWSCGALACYSAIEQEGPERLRSLTVLDQTPKPLATGAAGEWAEMDLTEFLDEDVGPMVADREVFAANLVGSALGRAPGSRERGWLEAMHLSTPGHVAVSLLVSAMFSDYRDLAGLLNSTLPLANVISREWLDEARRGCPSTRPARRCGRCRPISGSGTVQPSSTRG